MFTIAAKEIRTYLSSLIAYIVVVVFLLAIGLFMWVFPETNALDFGYANLDTLFTMAPMIFIFLISAISMKLFSEEKKSGTVELLTTHPVSDWNIVLGKFIAGFCIVIFALIPTLLYFYSIYQLGSPVGNIDTGATWGSFIGLFMLGGCYLSVGLFASSLTDNQIVAFLLSIFLCFFAYFAFFQLSKLNLFAGVDQYVEWLGINYHYESISRGVIDTRDLVYFFSFMAVFLGATKMIFSSRKW